MVEQLELHILGDAMVEADGDVACVLRHLIWHVLIPYRQGAEVSAAHAEEHLSPGEHLKKGRCKVSVMSEQVSGFIQEKVMGGNTCRERKLMRCVRKGVLHN